MEPPCSAPGVVRTAPDIRRFAAAQSRLPVRRFPHGSSVVSFFEPILRAHVAQHLNVFLYAEVSSPDAVTQRLKTILPINRWHFIQSLSDAAAASLIRSHGIDVLVDLGGHTRGNRLGVFAQRAAPVQPAQSRLLRDNRTGRNGLLDWR